MATGSKMEQDSRALVIDAGGQTVKIQKSYGIIVVHKNRVGLLSRGHH
jgi:hypothetical protein